MAVKIKGEEAEMRGHHGSLWNGEGCQYNGWKMICAVMSRTEDLLKEQRPEWKG